MHLTDTEFAKAEAMVKLILDLKQGARFKRRPVGGVAWYYSRPVICHPEEFDSDEEAWDHDSDARRGICGCPESGDKFWGIMVGDDREFLIDFEDVELIDDDDYCASCGQIGCSHG